ncbi:MAG: c-type cytochrome [Myxococcota bacterium]
MKSLSLCALAAIGLSMAGCRGYESEEPPVHVIRNMQTQEKGKAYRQDSTGLFPDGRMMRPPVPGTVAQGQLNLDTVLEDGLDEAGEISLKFPEAVKENGQLSPALVARGEARYKIYCSPCHGVELDGKGVIAEVGFDSNPRLPIPPPSFHDARLKTMPVGKIYAAIKNGVNDGNMGSYAGQIPVPDRWAIISYIRSQQKAKDPSVEAEGGVVMVVAKVDKASAEHGAQLYVAKGCNACHTTDGNKLVGPSFKGLYGRMETCMSGDVMADDSYLRESIKNPTAKVVMGYPPAMPVLPLTDLEVDSLVLFIQGLK